MRHLVPAALLLVSMPALASELPRDVAAFVARRDRCDHFRGEEADDPARAAAIARALEANCRGTDAELARLKRRHAGDPAVRARLSGYDPRIE
jgi:hypothetical protein